MAALDSTISVMELARPHVPGRQKGRLTPYEWDLIQKFRLAEMARESDEPDRPRRAYGYRRCSHEDSKATRGGLDVQTNRINAEFQCVLQDHPELEWHSWFDDEAVSATENHFLTRRGANKLYKTAKCGDHIFFSELNRAFRSTRDALNTIDLFAQRGVILHFSKPRVDMSTPEGRFMVTVMAAIDEMEADRIGERTRACFAAKRAQGYWIGGRIPPGYKKWGQKGFQRLVPLHPHALAKLRAMAALVVQLRDASPRWSFEKICAYVKTRFPDDYNWKSLDGARSLYEWEKKLQAEEATPKRRGAAKPSANGAKPAAPPLPTTPLEVLSG